MSLREARQEWMPLIHLRGENMIDNGIKRVLLVSNSTLYGSSYLDHAESEIRDFLGNVGRVLFVPYALYDRDLTTGQKLDNLPPDNNIGLLEVGC